jgi:trk system potassium uptake protein TrkH
LFPRIWPAILSLGWILLAMAGAEAVMAVVAFLADDGEATAFATGAAITATVGGGAVLSTKGRPFTMGFRDAVVLTVSAWFVLPLFAAIPFLLEPVDLTPVDAFFEMVSAVTTTGSTVMVGLDDAPPSLLLWRSTIQWLGGFGIIGLAIVILPFLKIGGMQLLRLESSDRSEKALPRVRKIAQAIGQIYIGLTVACFATYALLGMTPFDALNHAFTTLSTAGFSTHDASFGYFESPALQWAAVVFMISGAVPFLAYLRLFGRGTLRDRLDPQVPFFFLALTAVVVGVAAYLVLTEQHGVGTALTEAAFNIVSIFTTTGYASSDYMQWGSFAIVAFFIVTLIGGCSGSTSGGIKIMRYQIMGATVRQQVQRLVFPHSVQPIRFGSRTVSDDQVVSVAVFVTIYVAVVAFGAVVLSATGLDFMTAASSVAQAMGNVGPGLGDIVGPAGNFASLTDFQKIVVAVTMIIGRLEILSVLVLFAPSFYR